MGLTILAEEINEQTTGVLSFKLEKLVAGVWLPLSPDDLLTLTLTYYDVKSGTILNNRNAQNVFNTNDVTISDTGVVSWIVQADDAVVVGTGLLEEHAAFFRWTWEDGQQSEEIHHLVRNVTQVS